MRFWGAVWIVILALGCGKADPAEDRSPTPEEEGIAVRDPEEGAANTAKVGALNGAWSLLISWGELKGGAAGRAELYFTGNDGAPVPSSLVEAMRLTNGLITRDLVFARRDLARWDVELFFERPGDWVLEIDALVDGRRDSARVPLTVD